MPELLDILIHLPSGWALIALAIFGCAVVVFLLDYLRRAALPENAPMEGW